MDRCGVVDAVGCETLDTVCSDDVSEMDLMRGVCEMDPLRGVCEMDPFRDTVDRWVRLEPSNAGPCWESGKLRPGVLLVEPPTIASTDAKSDENRMLPQSWTAREVVTFFLEAIIFSAAPRAVAGPPSTGVDENGSGRAAEGDVAEVAVGSTTSAGGR
jgi:hypothetical protein